MYKIINIYIKIHIKINMSSYVLIDKNVTLSYYYNMCLSHISKPYKKKVEIL